DVPIFIHGKSAIATGVGEKLKSCDFGQHHYLLFFPPCSVNTASVFSDIELKRDQLMVSDTDALNPENWINDCLAVVLKHYPEVRDLYQLISKTVQVRMSGTGSTLFAIFKDKKAALRYQSEFCKKIKTVVTSNHRLISNH
ncbi:MAG: 4-(cytidine 5'-diphospho)-2-C-methyl-D-erythritol kinase, partial [Proteobacteria bacterium]|nr:4-(cytidine 5'-diphospho)-2-C-methyl-D-erythritol kinase [Pseudomonadota bacterium]